MFMMASLNIFLYNSIQQKDAIIESVADEYFFEFFYFFFLKIKILVWWWWTGGWDLFL